MWESSGPTTAAICADKPSLREKVRACSLALNLLVALPQDFLCDKISIGYRVATEISIASGRQLQSVLCGGDEGIGRVNRRSESAIPDTVHRRGFAMMKFNPAKLARIGKDERAFPLI